MKPNQKPKKVSCSVCTTSIKNSGSDKSKKSWHALLRFLQRENPKKATGSQKYASWFRHMKKAKASMCSRCSRALNQFQATYQTYEFSRLQLEQSLQSLQHAMVMGDKDENLRRKFEKRMQPKGIADLGNSIVAAALRKTTLQKCTAKLKRCNPRVSITKLETSSKVCTFRSKISPQNLKVTNPKLLGSSHKSHGAVSTQDKSFGKNGTKIVTLLKCNFCDKMLSKTDTWTNHMYTVHIFDHISPFLPKLTGEECVNYVTQVMKRIRTSKLDKYKCLYCSHSTTVKRRVKIHMLSTHLQNVIKDIKAYLNEDNPSCSSRGKNSPKLKVVKVTQPPGCVSSKIPDQNNHNFDKKLSLKIKIPLKNLQNKSGVTTLIRAPDKANLWKCPHCPSKFPNRKSRRNHLKEMHLPNYIFSLLSAPYPCSHSIDTVSKVVTQILDESKSKFCAAYPTKMYQCPSCDAKVTSPKRHIFQTHFHSFFTTIQERLSAIEQQEMDGVDLDSSSWSPSLSPITLPDDFVQQVIQATEQYDIQISDIFSTITDLD